MDEYLNRSIPMLASRGCPYLCHFCSNPSMWGTRWVARQPADVVDEIAHYKRTYRIDHVEFFDLTTIVDRRWILAFTERLVQAKLGITWTMPSGTRSEAPDAAGLEKLLRCGPDRPVRARPRPLPPGRRLRRRRELALLVGVLLRAEHPGDRRRHHVDLLHRSVPAAPLARRPDVYASCLRTPEDLVRASRRGPDPASRLGPIRACRQIRGRRPSRGGAGAGRLGRRAPEGASQPNNPTSWVRAYAHLAT